MVVSNGNEVKEAKTSIQISIETRERIIRLGIKNESYDDVLKRILDTFEANSHQ